MESNLISIKINQTNNPKLQEYFNTNLPIFKLGDSITGLILFNLNNGEAIKHRGITVALSVSLWNQNSCVDTAIIESKLLLENGTLNYSYSSAFDFKVKEDLPPTFIGHKYSFKYQILVTIKKLFGSIQASSQFIVYKPFTNVNQIKKQLLTVSCPSFTGDFAIQDIYMNNEIAKIIFHTSFIEGENVESIRILFQEYESYKDSTSTATIFNYQVCDGPPRQDVSFPVFLDFAAYHLSQSIQQNFFPFQVNYFMIISIMANSKEIRTKPMLITLEQPELV